MQKCPNKFHEGDVVIGVKSFGSKDLTGTTGIVIRVDHFYYGVVWEKDIEGHSLEGLCKAGYGWWVTGDIIEPYNLSLENK